MTAAHFPILGASLFSPACKARRWRLADVAWDLVTSKPATLVQTVPYPSGPAWPRKLVGISYIVATLQGGSILVRTMLHCETDAPAFLPQSTAVRHHSEGLPPNQMGPLGRRLTAIYSPQAAGTSLLDRAAWSGSLVLALLLRNLPCAVLSAVKESVKLLLGFPSDRKKASSSL